jgi:signal transduction histidine kinase
MKKASSFPDDQKDSASHYYQKAATLARQQKQVAVFAEASRQLGVIAFYRGDYKKALQIYQQAITFVEANNNLRSVATLYNELAMLYKKYKDLDLAEEYFRKALDYSRKANHWAGIGNAYNNIGLVYESRQQLQKAVDSYQLGLANYQKCHDLVGEGYSLEYLGGAYAMQKKYDLAEKYLYQSLQIRLKTQDRTAIAINYVNLGEFYNRTGNQARAIEYAQKSLALSRSIQFFDLVQYNYGFLSELYAKTGNYAQAFDYQKTGAVLKDSLYNAQTTQQINDMKIRFETEKKEKEIKLLRSQNEVKSLELSRRNLLIVALVLFLILVGIMGWLLYRNYRQRQESRIRQERERISMELHDNIGSHLTYLISSMDFLAYSYHNTSNGLSDKLEKMGESTRDTMQQLRNTIWVLNQETIDIQSLCDRLKNYAALKMETLPTEIHLDIPESLYSQKLDPQEALQVVRIVQEALQNAEKHAQATRLQVCMTLVSPKTLKVDIADNGRGFDTSIAKNGHYGLDNMKKRAGAIGGCLQIQSVANQGTTVSLEFPIA